MQQFCFGLQLLTTQIADQLRYAVTQELLDLKILQTPLSQPQLLLLNQLLHRVSKFELANKELKVNMYNIHCSYGQICDAKIFLGISGSSIHPIESSSTARVSANQS